LPADIYFKFLKLKREDAIFICGSDQHGTPIELKALKLGVEPAKLANDLHIQIKEILEKFECSFTIYGSTNSKENEQTVDEIFLALMKNGFIKEISSELAYCNTDKRFLSDRFIEGTSRSVAMTKHVETNATTVEGFYLQSSLSSHTALFVGEPTLLSKKQKILQ
jgi:methionyl-tRNA synthetase